jgi:insertion element IS1 protein InsB
LKTSKKSSKLQAVNEAVLERLKPSQTIVRLCCADDADVEAELDEMWSFVQSKCQQRWLWWAIDHNSGEVLAYILADRKDKAFTLAKISIRTVWDYAIL